jgi:uncharacterized repeat protein (TIGR01451 family)
MLEKLLSQLPYNPNAAQQLRFYAGRLRAEKSIRQIGFVFILLTFFVQFFAFISPPQPTMARSNNDIVDGGFSSKTEAVNFCKNDIGNFQSILEYYGISCADLSHATTASLKSTDYNKRLYSMGRLPYGKKGETPVNINGKTYYFRYLWSWDTGAYSTYKVLKGVSSVTGKTFYILYRCGNLTFVGLPAAVPRCTWNSTLFANDKNCHAPLCALDHRLTADSPKCQSCPYDKSILKSDARCVQCPYPGFESILKSNPKCQAPCPYDGNISATAAACKPCSSSQTRDDKTACLELSKIASNLTTKTTDANGTTASSGDTIEYTLIVKNTGKALVSDYIVQENISDVLDYSDVVDLHGGKLNDQQIVTWPAQNIAAGQSVKQRLTVKIKTTLPATPASVSDPGHYDNALTNVYGNTVTIYLPKTVIKTTEQVVSTLPKTGPGAGVTLSFVVTLFAGYLFARTRLLGREAETGLKLQDEMGVQV